MAEMSVSGKRAASVPTGTTASHAAATGRLQAFVSSPMFLGGYIVLMIVCGLVIDQTHRRMFALPGVKRHFYNAALLVVIVAFLAAYAAAVVQVFRTTTTWKSRLLFGLLYLPITFRWVVFFAVAPMSVAEALLYFAPRAAVTYDTTVLQSDGYRHRGSRISEATFLLPGQGRVLLTDTDWKPSHLFFKPMMVNGVCPLDRLPIGLPITVHARHSSLGNAIDRVTSAGPCVRPVD